MKKQKPSITRLSDSLVSLASFAIILYAAYELGKEKNNNRSKNKKNKCTKLATKNQKP